MNITFDTAPQGSAEWLAARRGRITGSRFKDALGRLADKPEKIDKKTGEITLAVRGAPNAKAMLYAMDTARERFGGTVAPVYVNAAMRTGTEQEPIARAEYEADTGNVVMEAGFAASDDGRFGCSVDGLVGDDGIIEIKTMVSSENLFTAVVDGDYSEFLDQINGSLWLLNRQWCDLVLWAPDLPLGALTVVRIERDEAAIAKLAGELLAFDALVEGLHAKLSARALKPAPVETVERLAFVARHGASPTEVVTPAATKFTLPLF